MAEILGDSPDTKFKADTGSSQNHNVRLSMLLEPTRAFRS